MHLVVAWMIVAPPSPPSHSRSIAPRRHRGTKPRSTGNALLEGTEAWVFGRASGCLYHQISRVESECQHPRQMNCGAGSRAALFRDRRPAILAVAVFHHLYRHAMITEWTNRSRST